jgi:hypothetical protein
VFIVTSKDLPSIAITGAQRVRRVVIVIVKE